MHRLLPLICISIFLFSAPVKASETSALTAKIRTLDIQGINLNMPIDEMKRTLEQANYTLIGDIETRVGSRAVHYSKDLGGSKRGHSINIYSPSMDSPYAKEIQYSYNLKSNPPYHKNWTEGAMGKDAQRMMNIICDKFSYDWDSWDKTGCLDEKRGMQIRISPRSPESAGIEASADFRGKYNIVVEYDGAR